MHTAAAVAAAAAIHLIPNPPTSCKTESTNGHSHTNIYTHTHTQIQRESHRQAHRQRCCYSTNPGANLASLTSTSTHCVCAQRGATVVSSCVVWWMFAERERQHQQQRVRLVRVGQNSLRNEMREHKKNEKKSSSNNDKQDLAKTLTPAGHCLPPLWGGESRVAAGGGGWWRENVR